jgi:hypothetical protein
MVAPVVRASRAALRARSSHRALGWGTSPPRGLRGEQLLVIDRNDLARAPERVQGCVARAAGVGRGAGCAAHRADRRQGREGIPRCGLSTSDFAPAGWRGSSAPVQGCRPLRSTGLPWRRPSTPTGRVGICRGVDYVMAGPTGTQGPDRRAPRINEVVARDAVRAQACDRSAVRHEGRSRVRRAFRRPRR